MSELCVKFVISPYVHFDENLQVAKQLYVYTKQKSNFCGWSMNDPLATFVLKQVLKIYDIDVHFESTKWQYTHLKQYLYMFASKYNL